MLSSRLTIFRNIGIGFLFLIGFISCEKDLEDIAVSLTGDKPFEAGDTIIGVIAYHRNVDSSRVDNNISTQVPLYLLGVNNSAKFGFLKGDILAQLNLPLTGADFGDNAVIDRVVLDIPYFATRDGDQNAVDPDSGLPVLDENNDTIQVPNFTLDSIYGNKNLAFTVSVNELGTFLNSLDPNDPSKSNSYFSDKEYLLNDKLHESSFLADRNDTVLYVERRFLDDDPSTVDDIDTIIASNSAPSIKFDLDKDFFKNRFVDHGNSSDFASNANFTRYFRGLYISAEGIDGSLMNLRGSNATMTIYYTNEEIDSEEDDEDLNYNGITGEDDVLVRTKRSQIYTFGGVISGHYERSYSGSEVEMALTNPDMVYGSEKLYVQGAAGSEVIIEVLDQESVDQLRQENVLINEANIIVYVDGDQGEVPERLFLYQTDFHSLITDAYNVRFGEEAFGGKLEYDADGNPEKYKFRITDYLSRVLDADDPIPMSKLTLRNYLSTDSPNLSLLDTVSKDWNWIPKGVVLYGNRPEDNDKRIKLELYYSE